MYINIQRIIEKAFAIIIKVLLSEATDGSNIHRQLVVAQQAIFEADLIEQVC